MAWCDGMKEPRLVICPMKGSRDGDQSENRSGEGCILSLIHPKSGNSTSYMLKDGLLQEFHWFKQSYGSWFLADYVCEDGSLYINTPVDPIFILLPIFSNARLKRGKEQGMFRQIDEILFNNDYPSYQCLEPLAEESMQLVCEVKEIGSSKFFRLDDSKVLCWLCCKVQHLKEALIKLDQNFSAQEEKEILKEAVSILGEYLKDDPWLKLLCNHLKLDLTETMKESPRIQDDLIFLEKSPAFSHPQKGKGSSGTAKTSNGKQSKKLKVETDSHSIKDMFRKVSRRAARDNPIWKKYEVASFYGWPVSTTHCIVGAMVGFGLVYGGIGAVFWSSLARVTSSWVISPVMGAAASFIVYKCIRRFVYSADNPGQAAAASAPIAVFLGVTGISFAALPLSKILPIALVQALACGSIGAFIVSRIIHKQLGHLLSSEAEKPAQKDKPHLENIGFLSDIAGPKGAQLEIVYGVFGYMQVLSACFMSFAHGGNDVSNAIGPLAAALSILQGGITGTEIVIPTDVLAWGGFGIVAGLMMWGHRVIATIGKKITELTPTRGFAAEFAAASVVLVASKLGLPISATHTLVGAVMGVGFARGLNNVRAETVREIVTSWVVTIPVGGFLSVIYTLILTKLLPNFI